MKKGAIFFVLIFLILRVYALNADFACPEENEQEFNCNIKVTNFTGTYDLKVDFMQDSKRVSKIWNNGWKSTNYYLIGFITDENEKEVKLLVNATGNVSGVLKLRKTGKTAIDFSQDISVFIKTPNQDDNEDNNQINDLVENNSEDSMNDNNDINKIEDTKQENTISSNVIEENNTIDIAKNENSQINQSESIINLNPQKELTVIYESKTEKIKQYSIFGFALFLVFIIIVLIIKM